MCEGENEQTWLPAEIDDLFYQIDKWNKLPDLILQSPHNFSAANIYASKASLIRETAPKCRRGG
jgi:hypothetical protein